jgi:hypothetical protein
MSKPRGLRKYRRRCRRRHEESAAKLAAAIGNTRAAQPTANDTKPAADAADIEHAAGDVPAVPAH